MPPNLGGFFMVRSYYPSECHADYFDFERIEALKPAIEACGISTDRKSGSAGMPRPISYAVFCLKKKKKKRKRKARNRKIRRDGAMQDRVSHIHKLTIGNNVRMTQ